PRRPRTRYGKPPATRPAPAPTGPVAGLPREHRKPSGPRRPAGPPLAGTARPPSTAAARAAVPGRFARRPRRHDRNFRHGLLSRHRSPRLPGPATGDTMFTRFTTRHAARLGLERLEEREVPAVTIRVDYSL